MARQVLTDRTLKALKPAPTGKRLDIMDAVMPSFGVRVTDRADAKGRAAQRTFIFVARYPGSSNPTRRALGEYGVLTLEEAREKARAWHVLITNGIDPREEERGAIEERDRRRQVEEQRNENNFSAVTERFIREHVRGSARGTRRAGDTEREIRKELVSRWGGRRIDEITKQDVRAMVREIKDRGAPAMARNVLGHAKVLFGWAAEEDLIEHSPAAALKSSKLIGEKKPRQRVLADAELLALWRVTGQLGYPFGPLLRLLLLTGTRKNEAAGARWREIDLGARLWRIPAERFKSESEHLVPLTDEALIVLTALPRFNDDDHIFSTTFGKVAVSGFSKAKARVDAAMSEELGSESPRWVVHDIRRTVRTRLAGLRVPDEVAEMVIGHGRRGIQRVYDQHKYLEEMREALDGWSNMLKDIISPSRNIIRFRNSVARAS